LKPHFHSIRIRLGALLLLGSVMTGLLAPAAVAMSRTDIELAADQDGLSSDVQDFFEEVLEDAMLRSAVVAPISAQSKQKISSAENVLFVIQGDFDARDQTITRDPLFSSLADQSIKLRIQLGFMSSGSQPLGP